ncbi:MAG: adenosine deaminase family protein [Planctomycetota bacterium]
MKKRLGAWGLKLDLTLLRALPKVDLHRHLEGSLRLETLWEFHCRNGQRLHASFEALKAACTIPRGVRPGFQGFMARFPGLRFRFGGVEALERLAAEAVSDAAADGVVHLELRFSPVFCALRVRGPAATKPQRRARARTGSPGGRPSDLKVTPEEAELAAAAVVRGARREALRRGISVGFIVTLKRDLGIAANEPQARLLERPVGRELAGLDLAGDEAFPAADFAPYFREWKAAGRGLTIHAGEDPGGAGADNVRHAVFELGADRIGHGVRAHQDKELLGLLARKGTALELCPTSNVQTRACRSFRAHPLKALLAAGAAATINTDDPAVSQTTLSRECLLAATRCGLSLGELRACTLQAACSAFLGPAAKAALARRITAGWPGTCDG